MYPHSIHTPRDLIQAAVWRFMVDSGHCVLAGREDFLPEDSLRLQEPQRRSLLLPGVRHPCHQPVPRPNWAQALPQRGQLDLQLSAVPLPGMGKAFWKGAWIMTLIFSKACLEAGSWLSLCLLSAWGRWWSAYRAAESWQLHRQFSSCCWISRSKEYNEKLDKSSETSTWC